MNLTRSCRIERIKNEKLLPFLMLDPIYNGHAIYVCKNKMDGTSLAAVCAETNEIHGTLVTGKPENYIVWGYWLTASSYDAAKALINEIREETDVDINYPLWSEPIIKEYFPKAELTIDNLYIYPEADARALEDKNSVAQKLTKELFESVTVPKEFKNLLSSEDLLPESKFYCVVEDGVLCAIGERVVDSGQSAVISQLRMLMYGKEASNRKQEIDRQHYTIPNQRPKDKHCGKI